MRLIFEQDIEQSDFIEIIMNEREHERLLTQGVVKDFPGGLNGKRNLNVFIRIDLNEGEEVPFKSKAQQAYLEINEPAVAKKFEQHTSKAQYKKLPKRVKKKGKK